MSYRRLTGNQKIRIARVCAAVLSLCAIAPLLHAGNLRLEKIWEVSLGERSSRLPGVCTTADGMVYVADPRGEWIVVDGQGKIARRQADAAIAGVTSLACSQDEHIYAAVRGASRVIIYSRDLTQLRAVEFPAPFRFIYLDEQGNIYGFGLAGGKMVHRLSPDGKLVSFGDAPAYGDADIAQTNTISATAVIDDKARRIIYKTENPYRLYVYDFDGKQVGVHDPDPSFAPTRVEDGRPQPSDFTGPMVRLRNGEYVVLTVRPRNVNGVWQQPLLLDVLDSSFQRVGSAIPALGFGMLMTKDVQDNLYGIIGAPTLRLIKARLVESTTAPR